MLRGFPNKYPKSKVINFFIAFLPQFIPARPTTPFALMISMSVIFMVLTLLIFVACGFMAVKFSSYISSSLRALK